MDSKVRIFVHVLSFLGLCIDFWMVMSVQVNKIAQGVRICAQIFLENWSGKTIQTLQLVDNFTDAEGAKISQILLEYFQESRLMQVIASFQHFEIFLK